MLLLILFFIFTTLSHAVFLIFIKQHSQISEQKRNNLWLTHLWWNGIIWAVLFLWIIGLQFTFPQTLNTSLLLKLVGLILLILGAVIVIAISLALDFRHLMGLRFFYPSKARRMHSFLYKVLNNPMYDGFLLILIGLALHLGIVEDFYLALISFLLLNIFLATVENYEFGLNPF